MRANYTYLHFPLFFNKKTSLYLFPFWVFVLVALVNGYQFSNVITIARDAQVFGSDRTTSILKLRQTPLSDYRIYLPLITKNDTHAYYVSTSGNDTNPGTFNQPWRTIGKAARMVSPGDLVYIRGGVYSEVVEVRVSGTENQPIRFMAYPGETPIIDGYNRLPTYWVGLFSMLGDWIQVYGIETRNSKYDGFGLYGNHDTADNVFAHHSQYHGVLIKSDYGTVQNSRFWRNSLMNEYGKSGNGSSALYAALDFDDGIADYAIMRNNVVWENWGEGISTSDANRVVIENNISHDNYSANIYITNSTNIHVEGNIVYMNPNSYVYNYGANVGIMMGDEFSTPQLANITITNNIAYGNNRNLYWWRGAQGWGMNNVLIANNTFVNSTGTSGVIIMKGSHHNVNFKNNITRQDGNLPVIILQESNPELHFSNNLWSKPPLSPYPYPVPGDIVDDPSFAETGGNPYVSEWFILTDTSPAIDVAITLPDVVVDFFGKIRGALPDMGAIEYFPNH